VWERFFASDSIPAIAPIEIIGVRRERGADALKEMIELAEDPYATD
jgi:hypothetical protein